MSPIFLHVFLVSNSKGYATHAQGMGNRYNSDKHKLF